MAVNRIGSRIEALIQKGKWSQAQTIIEKQLVREPDDHWLWARLSGVKYEQRDYLGALEAANKAMAIVPDCPLAVWSYANAAEMRGELQGAIRLYAQLFDRGFRQLKRPDEDANECWEGPDWTAGLMADCAFRIAGSEAKLGQRDKAVKSYWIFLNLVALGWRGLYSREDAQERLNKLLPNKKAKLKATTEIIKNMKSVLTPQTAM